MKKNKKENIENLTRDKLLPPLSKNKIPKLSKKQLKRLGNIPLKGGYINALDFEKS